MKRFESMSELYRKISELQNEIKDHLDSYLDKEKVGIDSYEEVLYERINELTKDIFHKLTSGESECMNYLANNVENLSGDAQIISAFIKAYIVDQIIDTVATFDLLKEHQETERVV